MTTKENTDFWKISKDVLDCIPDAEVSAWLFERYQALFDEYNKALFKLELSRRELADSVLSELDLKDAVRKLSKS